MSADDILLGAKLAEDTVPVCTRGDLVDEFRRLDRELVESRAKAAADPRLAGSGATAVEARLSEIKGQIEAATVQFRLRALGRRWNRLVEEHPPRKAPDGKVNEEDARNGGVNTDTFFPALIRASTVEPQLRDETWDALLDPDGKLLNEAQYRRLKRSCWDLNVQEPDVPFSFADWLKTRDSASGSDSPAPSASASNGSTGGKPRKSRSTATKTGS